MHSRVILCPYGHNQITCKLSNILAFLLLIILFANNSCFASIYQLKDEVDAYNQRDYQNTIFIGRILANESAGLDNEIARYYLANAYVRLKRTQEAIQEYRVCWIEGKDQRIKAYARDALRTLDNCDGARAFSPQDFPMNMYKKGGQNRADIQSAQDMNSNGPSNASNIRFTPIGSSHYVKNYVNYDGDSSILPVVPGLKAVPQTLMLKTPPKNQ